MLKVSIIIPTLNEEGVVGKTISSVLEQSFKVSEIIVVDAGSKDNTIAEISAFSEVAVVNHKPPVGEQRTVGGNKASGDILVFLDADVILDKHFIEKAVQTMERKKIDVACPLYWPNKSTLPIQLAYGFFVSMFIIFQHIFPSGAGSGILVRKDIFQKIGGFEGEIKFDDIAFIRKAARHGKFRMLYQKLLVSDRRFREYGASRMFLTYLVLSVFFILGLFKTANVVGYQFGKFKKTVK